MSPGMQHDTHSQLMSHVRLTFTYTCNQTRINGQEYHSAPTIHCVITISRGAAGGTLGWGGSRAGASQHLAEEGRHGRAECFWLLLHGHMAACRELLVAGATVRTCAQQLRHLARHDRSVGQATPVNVSYAATMLFSGHLGPGGGIQSSNSYTKPRALAG
jgi:hypothetical protein